VSDGGELMSSIWGHWSKRQVKLASHAASIRSSAATSLCLRARVQPITGPNCRSLSAASSHPAACRSPRERGADKAMCDRSSVASRETSTIHRQPGGQLRVSVACADVIVDAASTTAAIASDFLIYDVFFRLMMIGRTVTPPIARASWLGGWA